MTPFLRRLPFLPWFLAGLAATGATLDTRRLSLRIDDATGAWSLVDRVAQVTWTSHPTERRFGEAVLMEAGKPRSVPLVPAEVEATKDEVRLTFRPMAASASVALGVRIRAVADGEALDFEVDPPSEGGFESIRLLDGAFETTDADGGYVVVPTREGLLIPADSGLAFTHRFDTYTYEGCHLQMFGVTKAGAALMVTWTDPYVALDVRSAVSEGSTSTGRQSLTSSLSLRKSARAVRVRVLGRGGYVEMAKAYRRVARDRGLLETWDRKLRANPERAKYLGASNYKLWSMLDRRMNEESTREESVRLNWTFDEAARVAEHLKFDLGLDRVLFTLGGWIHRGYDNQHPDVLPAAPECGGNQALADASRRILKLGYVLSLHDNYQDIYRDAPSWDEKWVNKNPDGSLTRGGVWAGGRAYVTCARMAFELARRPGNLKAIRQLTGANSYFIDTTYASGLYECFDPAHPMTRADDLKWKIALSDEARRVFGSFGSECGREWAVPHADFFEGLTGVSGRGFHDAGLQKKLGASIVPLFEMVYRDCIALYGKYGYDPAHAASYVLHHLALGRPLHYHNVPPHLYWRDAESVKAGEALGLWPAVAAFEPTGPREFRIRYRWTVTRTPPTDWRVFVHFVDPAGNIVFQNDHEPSTATSGWVPGEQEFGPFTVRVPDRAAGGYGVNIGLFDPATGRRARLAARESEERAYGVGVLRVTPTELRFEATAETPKDGTGPDPAIFQRGDGGWSAGLHSFDRFVKNTHEILSPLNELTARLPMTHHEFLDAGRGVQRSVFGSGRGEYEVVVNGGSAVIRRSSRQGGEVELPPGGFVAEGPSFVAFLATEWAGRRYESPALFTLRAEDGRAMDRSRKLRVFHGFGDPAIVVRGRVVTVAREEILER